MFLYTSVVYLFVSALCPSWSWRECIEIFVIIIIIIVIIIIIIIIIIIDSSCNIY